jgi:polar amino acid transport system ATP-binding protein
VDGISLWENQYRINDIRSNIGMVFQNFNLYGHLTVTENITLAIAHCKENQKRRCPTDCHAAAYESGHR